MKPTGDWRTVLAIGLLLAAGCGADAPGVRSGQDGRSSARGATDDAGGRAVAVEGEAAQSARYAFLVGVNDYSVHEDDQLRDLSFCVADMEAFQKKLSDVGFKRVYCLTTKSTTSLQPTKARIEARFQQLLDDKKMGSRDFVLVALSTRKTIDYRNNGTQDSGKLVPCHRRSGKLLSCEC